MKIVVLEPLGIPEETATAMLQTAVGDHEVVYYSTRTENTSELIERSRDADVVVLANLPYSREVMQHCPKLRYLCVAFTGYDHIDMDYCRERGIQVSNCAGYSTAAVADLVFGLVIALQRNLLPCNERIHKGGTKAGLMGPELEGQKFGIIGAGAIGLRVASIAQAFGCEVYAYSRTRKDIPGIHFVGLEELLSLCDIVSVHVPQNPETTGLLGAENIARMKPTAYLINTARGAIVDSEALAEALRAGKIAGAGIDVFETEPPLAENHPLLNAPNCICTPHIGFASHQAMEKRAAMVCANVKAWLEGHPIHLV